MKNAANKLAIVFACTTFALTSCEADKNNSSIIDSADQLYNKSSKYEHEDSILNNSRDTTKNAANSKDSQADPKGHIEKSNR